jgi:hypothetical protein
MTKRKPLPQILGDLLRDVVIRRCPELLEVLGRTPLSVTLDESNAVRQALTDEFCATGLRPDHEPNERGLQLEELIDYLFPLADEEEPKHDSRP